ncbi:AraC family transcriptional regulator [Kiloniella sp. EL199]|uniref:helix-turn-helix transcriptional regulator n=1 Tax=Kiloniella sp. EL199 TaxID=2107581 RepID=UPI000EA281B7|nr:AraC family transcriptional regulator [Kiloniella sp. EL199]
MKVNCRSYTSDFKSHNHSTFHQLIIPHKGELELEAEQSSGIARIDQVAIITANDTHAFRGLNPNSFTVVDFDFADANYMPELNSLWDSAHNQILFPLDEGLLNLSQFTASELKDQSITSIGEQSIKLFLLALADRNNSEDNKLPEKLQKALKFIKQNHTRKLSSKDIAEQACLSISHLHALFSNYLGYSPQRFQTNLKLEHARQLVLNTKFSLTEIAHNIGYSDQSSFNRAYRNSFGTTPGTDRTLHNKV